MTEKQLSAKQIKTFFCMASVERKTVNLLTYICGIASMSRGVSLPHSDSQFTANLTVKVNCKQMRTFPLPAAVSTSQKRGVMPYLFQTLSLTWTVAWCIQWIISFCVSLDGFFIPWLLLYLQQQWNIALVWVFAVLFLTEREVKIFPFFLTL